MSVALERAKSSWLLAFGDVITLLITLFIMTLALNKGEISKIQRWVDTQVTESYVYLQNVVTQQSLQEIKVTRTARGIAIVINNGDAFTSGGYVPSAELLAELQTLGGLLPQVPLFNMRANPTRQQVISRADEEGYQWVVEVNIEGHTDNDPIDPNSRLRNNWFLSTMRAQAVMQALYQASQLPANIFSVGGYGEWHPITSNDTLQGRADNRRVVVLISASFQKAETH